MYRQIDLRSDDRRLTCWVKCDGTHRARLRVGALITLKHEPDVWWEVTNISVMSMMEPPRQFWKVGGLL